MKDYIDAEIKEDCIILTLSELAKRRPRREIRHDLEEYMMDLRKKEQHETDVRLVEIEECYGKYAQLIVEHIDAGKDLPLRKSYSLNA